MTRALKVDKHGKLKISEADIEETCSDWLAFDGWRRLKTNPCSDRSRGKGFGELGKADDLYVRYLRVYRSEPQICLAHVMWIEWKSARGQLSQHQRAWTRVERLRSALVLVAGLDFPASIEGFQDWYRASGLMRFKI